MVHCVILYFSYSVVRVIIVILEDSSRFLNN